jgi:MFS family permease
LLPFIMQEYGINRGSAGWFASAAPITIAIVSLPVGILAARFSIKKAFAAGALLQAAGILAPLVSSYEPLLLTRVLFAAGAAITVPLSTAIATQWFSSRKLPLFNGLTMTFINLGNAIAFAATVPIATFISWKAPMVMYGAFALTCALAWMVLGKNAPGEPGGTGASRAAVQKVSLKQAFSQRATLLLALAVFGSWGLWNSVAAWLPSYYYEVFGLPLSTASSIVTLVAVGGTIGCLAGGIIPVRMGRRKPMLIISGSFMGLALVSAILFNNLAVIGISIALLGLAGNLQNPSLFTIPMELPGASLRSGIVMLSMVQMGGNLGNFISPLVVGSLADITGSYLPGFGMFAVISLSSLVAGLMLPETGPRGKAVSRRPATGAPQAG